MTQPPTPPGWQPPTGAPPPPPGYGTPPGYGAPPGYQQPYGYQPYAVQAPKPGIIALRPLAVGEILDGAFATIRRHPGTVLGLSAAVACVQQALVLLVRALNGTLSVSISIVNGRVTQSNRGGSYVTLLSSWAIAAVASALLTGMLCLVVSDSVLGQPSSVRSAWTRLKPVSGRLLVVSILATLGEYLGLVLVVPGLFLWGVWALVIPALVLERTNVRGAFTRSWRLSIRDFWRVWGIRALAWFLAHILGGVVNLASSYSLLKQLFSTNGSDTVIHISTVTVVLGAVLAVLATTLTAPFLSGVVTLLYVDRRIRVEALDVQLQQAAAVDAPTYG